MTETSIQIKELHWMMDILQSIDVGLMVLDRNYVVKIWNSFMENHSGIRPENARDQSIFELFPDLPQKWFAHKVESVFLLKQRAFTIWEQRPHVFPFHNYRPITGTETYMYQDTTIIPLASVDSSVNHVCVIVYDVTDAATSKKGLQHANTQLQSLSRTDGLTQLNNRAYWELCLQSEYRRFLRTGMPCSLVMFDIDHFKKINDTYGHQAGDDVIRTVSSLLQKNLREADIAGRYGGEEFGVVLVNTNAQGALKFTERLRRDMERTTTRYETKEIEATISLGIAEINSSISDYTQWLEQADIALYKAKQAGRNQSCIFYLPECELPPIS